MLGHPVVIARLHVVGQLAADEHHPAPGALDDLPRVALLEHLAFVRATKRARSGLHGCRLDGGGHVVMARIRAILPRVSRTPDPAKRVTVRWRRSRLFSASYERI